MVVPRLAAALLLALALAAGATSARADTSTVPNGLHGFLLRADEPASTSFTRTPSFAWNAVPGATRYEFQLSTSSAFRDNGIVWKCPSAKCPRLDSPVAAPGVSLPWITGSPHALYARVRAVVEGIKGDWSDSFGFDIVPPAPPTPMASSPGLLRWTPVPGADGYEVWLIDAGKHEVTSSNVLDEREFYTFHQASQWTGTVRWRIRALRADWQFEDRVNGVPITTHGSWSPIYKSTNPVITSGQIRLASTASDVVTDGDPTDPAHKLMPAFTWTGNETLDGTQAELFRVYVFTDRQCVNRVFTGSIVGSPAYAGRPYGGLNLPIAGADWARARTGYLDDLASRSAEPPAETFDNEPVTSTESKAAAKATVTLPLVADNSDQNGSGGGDSGGTGDGGSGGSSGATEAQSPAFINIASGADLGAPVDLWDNDWPNGGYYWTVVPVAPEVAGAIGSTLAAAGPKGSLTLAVTSTPGFQAGDQVLIGSGANTEILTIQTVSSGAVTFTADTKNGHAAGEPIVRLGGSIIYSDLELPEDVCAAGRVARFGISSEPSLVTGDDPFASGLSPLGRLTSAVHTASFYKPPLVAWTPALGATAYQVEWSKTEDPFTPEPGPNQAEGVLTGATSYVLPSSVTPGTWYYRVRGYDWSLPANAQAMGWSDVAKIVITKPTFTVVGPSSSKSTTKSATTKSSKTKTAKTSKATKKH